jgi:hypothetical protein
MKTWKESIKISLKVTLAISILLISIVIAGALGLYFLKIFNIDTMNMRAISLMLSTCIIMYLFYIIVDKIGNKNV